MGFSNGIKINDSWKDPKNMERIHAWLADKGEQISLHLFIRLHVEIKFCPLSILL